MSKLVSQSHKRFPDSPSTPVNNPSKLEAETEIKYSNEIENGHSSEKIPLVLDDVRKEELDDLDLNLYLNEDNSDEFKDFMKELPREQVEASHSIASLMNLTLPVKVKNNAIVASNSSSTGTSRTGAGRSIFAAGTQTLFVDSSTPQPKSYRFQIPGSKFTEDITVLDDLSPQKIQEWSVTLLNSAKKISAYITTAKLTATVVDGYYDDSIVEKFKGMKLDEMARCLLANLEPTLVLSTRACNKLSVCHFNNIPISSIPVAHVWKVLQNRGLEFENTITPADFISHLQQLKMRKIDPRDKVSRLKGHTLVFAFEEYWAAFLGEFQLYKWDKWEFTSTTMEFFTKGLEPPMLRIFLVMTLADAIKENKVVKTYSITNGTEELILCLEDPFACYQFLCEEIQAVDKLIPTNPQLFEPGSPIALAIEGFIQPVYSTQYWNMAREHYRPKINKPSESSQVDNGKKRKQSVDDSTRPKVKPKFPTKDSRKESTYNGKFPSDAKPSNGKKPENDNSKPGTIKKLDSEVSSSTPSKDRSSLKCCLCEQLGHFASNCTTRLCWCGLMPGSRSADGKSKHNPFNCAKRPRESKEK